MDRKNSQPLDTIIYTWFEEYGSLKAFEQLDGSKEFREAQKNQFLEGGIENPTLDYPALDLNKLDKLEQQLQAFKELIWKDEVVYEDELPQTIREQVSNLDRATREAYLKRLNEKIIEIRMLKCSALMQEIRGSDRGKQEKEELISRLMRKFKKYSEFLYGNPSLEVFAYTLDRIKTEIQVTISDTDDENLRSAGQELMECLPNIAISYSFKHPDEEVISNAKDSTIKELGDLIEIPIEDGILGANEIKVLFEDALKKIDAEGWEVIILSDSSRTGINVSHEKKQVIVPVTKTLSVTALKSLILHEIGTHVARRVRGERSKLKLLGLGLFRYKDDEGVATLREQVLRESFDDFSGMEGHLAISLASGIDGIPKNFRETFKILKKYFLFKNLQKGKPREEAERGANNQAWARCVRTFRGTNCSTPGVCFNKDIFYRENNIDVWQVTIKNPEITMIFNVGKFDPSNRSHLTLLSQLGIIEADLLRLDSIS